MDDRRRDGGTNSTLRTKEQGTQLTLNEHDDDDDAMINPKLLRLSPNTLMLSNFECISPTHFTHDTDIDIFVNCNWVDTRWQ